MSIQNVQSTAQDPELYQIRRKTEAQNPEQVQPQQTAQEIPQSDEYDTTTAVGEEPEGIYSVSYDDEGNLQVNYTQPGEKATAAPQASPAIDSSEESSDDSEEEIEKLKKQRDQIRQQLNKEKDEDVKKALRTQLQMIEAQIAQLSSQQES